MLIHQSGARQKSCRRCAKGKRKCDLKLGGCSRCTSRGLSCQYASKAMADAVGMMLLTDITCMSSLHDCIEATQCPSPGILRQINEPLDRSSMINSPYSSYSSLQFPELAAMSKDQDNYCISQFKGCAVTLPVQNQTAFIHHQSYRVNAPSAYHDLLGVAALYSQKTPENEEVILDSLHSRSSSLVASSKLSSWSLEDHLLGVQALLLYQILRLFDGDIRQRANAEDHFVYLEAWTLVLQQSMASPDGRILRTPYQQWVFHESLRRAILVSILLRCVYDAIKTGDCTAPLLSKLPMSTNGSLWLMSEDEWWGSTRGHESHLITYREFVDEWNDGAIFNIESYETLLLTVCKHSKWPLLPLDTA